jgi:hypothetical protein
MKQTSIAEFSELPYNHQTSFGTNEEEYKNAATKKALIDL